MKKFFDFFKTSLGIAILVIAGIGLLWWGGMAIFKSGQESTLNAKLADVNKRLENTSARTNSEEHIQLLARRNYLQNLINKS